MTQIRAQFEKHENFDGDGGVCNLEETVRRRSNIPKFASWTGPAYMHGAAIHVFRAGDQLWPPAGGDER